MNRVRLLFVSATRMEVQSAADSCGFRKTHLPGCTLLEPRSGGWACLVTGPGVLNTAAGLGGFLARTVPEMVIDVGIAGVFPGTGMDIGDLALAETDTYAHTGVGTDRPLPFDLIPGLSDTRKGRYAMDPGALRICRDALLDAGFPKVPAGPFLTVSRITDTGSGASPPASEGTYFMESMEGAAVAHVCALHHVAVAQIRAASNLVGERDKSRWDIPAACRTLGAAVAALCRALA